MKCHIFLILAGINIIGNSQAANQNTQPNKAKQMPLDIPLNSNILPDADNVNPNPKFIPANMGENISNAQSNLTYNNKSDYVQ